MRYQNVLETIGNTPLIKINSLCAGCGAEIYVKFEAVNPSGSIKDRMALFMLRQAERKGILQPGMTIIEATTGNTGISFAMISAILGYKMITVMPENSTRQRRLIIEGFGAEVILTPKNLGPMGAIEKRNELHEKRDNSWIPGQFENTDNIKAHETGISEELIKQTGGEIDAFVAGIGSGGTLMGVAKALKKRNKKVLIVAVEPFESAVLSGDNTGSHDIQGIGEGFIPKIVDIDLIDRIEKVSTNDAKDMALMIARREGMLVGTSSGANMLASLRVAKLLGKGKRIVTIFPDRGERYLD